MRSNSHGYSNYVHISYAYTCNWKKSNYFYTQKHRNRTEVDEFGVWQRPILPTCLLASQPACLPGVVDSLLERKDKGLTISLWGQRTNPSNTHKGTVFIAFWQLPFSLSIRSYLIWFHLHVPLPTCVPHTHTSAHTPLVHLTPHALHFHLPPLSSTFSQRLILLSQLPYSPHCNASSSTLLSLSLHTALTYLPSFPPSARKSLYWYRYYFRVNCFVTQQMYKKGNESVVLICTAGFFFFFVMSGIHITATDIYFNRGKI